jgi:hypothetical protein
MRMSPRLAEFSGLVVFVHNREEHQRPHVQVRGGGQRATVDIATGDVLAGSPPSGQQRKVRALDT